MHSIRALFQLMVSVMAGLVLIISLTACERTEQAPVPGHPIADSVVEGMVNKLFEAIKAGDYEQAISVYHASFFQGRAPEAWVDELKAHIAERGPLQSYVLRRSEADTRFSGKFYILEYESVHDGNKRLHHLITLVNPVDAKETRLVGHKITPWEANN